MEFCKENIFDIQANKTFLHYMGGKVLYHGNINLLLSVIVCVGCAWYVLSQGLD